MTGVFSQKEQNIQKQGSRLEEQPQLTADELKELKEEFQIPVTDKYPAVSKELIKIKDNLVNSFIKEDFSYLPPVLRERMEQYQKILSESNLRIVLSESIEINAFHSVDKGIIVVNKGILREALEQGLGEDAAAFVIGHEISHLLYEKYSTWKKSQLNNHDMEYQCDKDAVTLMDVAGYNPYAAMVFKIEGSSTKIDYGLLTSHPKQLDRSIKLKEIIENGIWKNYSSDRIHELSKATVNELNGEDKISIQMKWIRHKFERHFFSQLDNELKYAVQFPSRYCNILKEPETDLKIPPIYEKRFKEFSNTLESLNPDYSKYAKKIFLTAESEAIHLVPIPRLFKILSLGDRSPSELLKIVRYDLPAISEVQFGSLYNPFPQKVLALISKYKGRVNNILASSPDLLNQDLIALSKECIRKMGIGFLSRIILESKAAREQLGDYFEQLGSRELVLLFSGYYFQEDHTCAELARNHRVIELLRKNSFCAQILDETLDKRFKDGKAVDLSFIPYEKRLELLKSKDCSKDLKAEIIASDILPLIRDKKIEPQDLVTVFNTIKESEIHIKKVNREKRQALLEQGSDESREKERKSIAYDERYFPTNIDFIDAIDSYTDGENESVKNYWHEQLLSIGVFPEGIDSLKKLTECLSCISSDTPNLDNNLCLHSNSSYMVGGYDKTLIEVTHLVNVSMGKIEEYDGCIASQRMSEEEYRKEHRKARNEIIWNASEYDLTEKQAFDLARCFTKVGYDSLEKKGFFSNLENVSRFWKEASSNVVLRTIPGNWYINGSDVYPHSRGFCVISPLIVYVVNGKVDGPCEIDLSRIEKADVSQNYLTEPIGESIEFRDYVFFKYLKEKDFSVLYFEKKEDAISWVENYLPRKGELRDIVLANIFERNNFDKELHDKTNKEFFLKFLSLYNKSSFRRAAVAGKIYQAFRDDRQPIDEKMSFISACFPHPCITRDEIIDEMLEKHIKDSGARMEDFYKVFNYYSRCNREAEKNKTILDGTLGAFVHNRKIEDKLALARWLFLKGEKPEFVTENEYTRAHVKLDFLPGLMASNELRHKTLEMLFFGKDGIAMDGNEKLLNTFIDDVFNKYFPLEDGSSQEEVKLLSFGREVVKQTLHNVDVYKREKLLCRMFDLAQDESTKNVEAFLPNWVAGYSASAVKFLQIVGSRTEVKKAYPELYINCERAKTNAERMSFFDMIVSLSTNEELRNGSYTITDIIGSASIKVVLKAKNKEGDEAAIKVLRQNAGKFVNEETDELRRIVESLKPTLKEIWGVESVPDIVERAAKASLDETDFIQEVKNSAILTDAIRDIYTDDFFVTTPTACYVDKNLIVESLGYGQTMDKWLELHPEDSEALAKHTQTIFLSLLNKNIVLADMHQGNILVDKDKSGKFKIILIDTGSLFALTDDEAKLYKKAIAGMVLSVMEKKGGRDLLLEGISSATDKFGMLSRIVRSVVEKKLSSENVLDGCVQELAGRRIYNENREMIKEKLEAIRDSDAVVSKPLQFLEMLDELKDENGERYLVPNSLYWSLIGLTKPFGLFDYQSENQELYSEVFRSAIV